MDKKQPFADTYADGLFLCYNTITTEKSNGGNIMLRFYLRIIIGIIWLVAAVVGLFTANFLMTIIGLIIGIVYLSTANNMRKKEKEKNNE